jgi:hypothetical protein
MYNPAKMCYLVRGTECRTSRHRVLISNLVDFKHFLLAAGNKKSFTVVQLPFLEGLMT